MSDFQDSNMAGDDEKAGDRPFATLPMSGSYARARARAWEAMTGPADFDGPGGPLYSAGTVRDAYCAGLTMGQAILLAELPLDDLIAAVDLREATLRAKVVDIGRRTASLDPDQHRADMANLDEAYRDAEAAERLADRLAAARSLNAAAVVERTDRVMGTEAFAREDELDPPEADEAWFRRANLRHPAGTDPEKVEATARRYHRVEVYPFGGPACRIPVPDGNVATPLDPLGNVENFAEPLPSNVRPVTEGFLANGAVVGALLAAAGDHAGDAEGAPVRLEGVADLVAFRLNTADPGFDPTKPVCINGFLFHPAKEA